MQPAKTDTKHTSTQFQQGHILWHLIWVYIVCSGLYVLIHRVITVNGQYKGLYNIRHIILGLEYVDSEGPDPSRNILI